MLYCIVTGRSLLWYITSLLATLLMLVALMSPHWLIGETKSMSWQSTPDDAHDDTIQLNTQNEAKFTYSIGVYTRCNPPNKGAEHTGHSCTTLATRGLSTDSKVFPNAWKAATVFIALGVTIMFITVVCGAISCCFQSIFKKSIFTTSGATQVIAGMCYIIGVMLYPMAWGSTRIHTLCGREVSPFYPGACSLGPGLYMAIIGTALTFLAACLSVPAEKSTSSDSVQDQIYEGNRLICFP